MKTLAATLRPRLAHGLALLLIGAPLAGACGEIADQAKRVAKDAAAQAALVNDTQESLRESSMNSSALTQSMSSCPAEGKCDFLDLAVAARIQGSSRNGTRHLRLGPRDSATMNFEGAAIQARFERDGDSLRATISRIGPKECPAASLEAAKDGGALAAPECEGLPSSAIAWRGATRGESFASRLSQATPKEIATLILSRLLTSRPGP